MFSYQFKTTMILLILGFISGVCMSILFVGCGGCNSSLPRVTTAKEIKKAAFDSNAAYQQRRVQLDTVKSRLQVHVAKTNLTLQQEKNQAAIRKEKVKKLIEPKGYAARLLIQKRDAPQPDTLFTKCDSLQKEVSLFIEENDRKDSLYETQIATMDSLVLVQGRIIENDSVAYRNLQVLFHSAVDHGEVMEMENKSLQKKMKRQKFKSKIVSIGLMLLSGAAANYFIHR